MRTSLVHVMAFLLAFAACVSMESAEQNSTDKIQPEPVIDRSSHHHHEPIHGIWEKRLEWKPRWVKTWKEKKMYVAVWKKIWAPVEVKEWIPIDDHKKDWHGD